MLDMDHTRSAEIALWQRLTNTQNVCGQNEACLVKQFPVNRTLHCSSAATQSCHTPTRAWIIRHCTLSAPENLWTPYLSSACLQPFIRQMWPWIVNVQPDYTSGFPSLMTSRIKLSLTDAEVLTTVMKEHLVLAIWVWGRRRGQDITHFF